MFKVGIIGSENSHALAFSKLFNLSGDYPDIQVTCVWGEDDQASQTIAKECGVAVTRPDDMLRQVDAVMVTSRNGALHPGYAFPFIEAGKPAFVDKPIANDGSEAEKLIHTAFEKDVPVMGGSSLKLVDGTLEMKDFARVQREKGELAGGYVFAPVNMDNPYGGFYFYSSHLVETALTIFGYDPVSVTASRSKAGIAAILNYDGFDVTLSFTDGMYRYGATAIAKESVRMREITLEDAYAREGKEFADMLRTGRIPQSEREIVLPIYVLNAIEKSFETGLKQPIHAMI